MASYEICETLEDADAKLAKINELLGYPNGATTYRQNFLHPPADPEDLRAIGIVESKLIAACSGMTAEERLEYYNDENLYSLLEVYEEGWFPDPE